MDPDDHTALIAKDVEWEIIRVCGEHFWRDPQLAERVRYALLAAEERGKAAAPAAEDGELLDLLEESIRDWKVDLYCHAFDDSEGVTQCALDQDGVIVARAPRLRDALRTLRSAMRAVSGAPRT
jgi:hypothetical protein